VGNQARTRNLLRGIACEQSGDILEGARDGTHLTASVALGPGLLVLDLAPGLTFPARRLQRLEAGSLPTVSSIFPTAFLVLPAGILSSVSQSKRWR
jgi:hypothetical protein